MPFKKKVIVLSSIAGALFIIYILTFIFSSGDRSARLSLWTPLSGKGVLDTITSIEIKANNEEILLEKEDGLWKLVYEDTRYPAQATRVNDFLAILTKNASYPVLSVEENSWSKFGLDEENARKLTLKVDGTARAVFFFGKSNTTGQAVYIRREGEREVREGEDKVSVYLDGERKSWYNLRLFPDDEKKPTLKSIQRLIVTPPEKDGSKPPSYTLVRNNDSWRFESGETAPDATAVDAVVRYVLDASADDFAVPADVSALSSSSAGNIVLEAGDLARIEINLLGKIGERNAAKMSGSDQVYLLSDWTVGRIWREKADLTAK